MSSCNTYVIPFLFLLLILFTFSFRIKARNTFEWQCKYCKKFEFFLAKKKKQRHFFLIFVVVVSIHFCLFFSPSLSLCSPPDPLVIAIAIAALNGMEMHSLRNNQNKQTFKDDGDFINCFLFCSRRTHSCVTSQWNVNFCRPWKRFESLRNSFLLCHMEIPLDGFEFDFLDIVFVFDDIFENTNVIFELKRRSRIETAFSNLDADFVKTRVLRLRLNCLKLDGPSKC